MKVQNPVSIGDDDSDYQYDNSGISLNLPNIPPDQVRHALRSRDMRAWGGPGPNGESGHPALQGLTNNYQTMHETPEQSESQISNLATANQAVTDHLQGAAMFGVAPLIARHRSERSGSRMANFGKKQKDDLPLEPGKAYLTHLYKYNNMGERLSQARKERETEFGNIFTDQPEAAKTALSLIGVYSEKNPGGLPIDFSEAKNLWFGKKEVNVVDEAGFRTTVENGDPNIDPKRVRKFVNYDGSLTWEILNQDRTVQSRFTMGDYAGTKVFAQGGYKTFAELLKKAKKKKGPDVGGEFDAIRTGGM